jgi:hypothetical protein
MAEQGKIRQSGCSACHATDPAAEQRRPDDLTRQAMEQSAGLTVKAWKY